MTFFLHTDAARGRFHTGFAGLLLLAIGFAVFGPSGEDDPYITFGSARELAQFHHIANINGEAVESGSSILHVTLLALAHQVSGLDLPLLGLIFSLAFALLCLPLTHYLARRSGLKQPALPVYLLCLSTAFTYWSMGSLETTLAAACATALICSLCSWVENGNRAPQLLCFLSATAFVLTRPEAIFVLLAFGCAAAICAPSVKRQLLLLVAVAAAVFITICLLRLHFFNQPFPQPVYAKADSFHFGKLLHGLLYFLFSSQLSLIIYAFLAGMPALHYLRKRTSAPLAIMLAACFCLAGLAFIIASGGDWMSGGRFFVPYLPLLVVVAAYFINKSPYSKRLFRALFILLAFELIGFSELRATGMPLWKMPAFQASLQPPVNWQQYSFTESSNYIHANDIVMLEAMRPIIHSALKTQQHITISGVQMGMIPYFLRDEFQQALSFVDMRGLTTQHITRCADFTNAKRLWTGIFVDYGDYFKAQQKSNCVLPGIDIAYELQNLNPADTEARMQALASAGYHIVYKQNTYIKGGLLQRKLMNVPYFIAVSDTLYQHLPDDLRYREMAATNVPSQPATP